MWINPSLIMRLKDIIVRKNRRLVRIFLTGASKGVTFSRNSELNPLLDEGVPSSTGGTIEAAELCDSLGIPFPLTHHDLHMIMDGVIFALRHSQY